LWSSLPATMNGEIVPTREIHQLALIDTSVASLSGRSTLLPKLKTWRAGWGPQGVWGSLWFIRWLGPVFRIGRNPAVSLFLGRKIPDMRDGAISSNYGNGPTTVLDHFRVKFGFLAHPNNTRLQQNGSIPNSTATIQTEHNQKADRQACGTHRWGSGLLASNVLADGASAGLASGVAGTAAVCMTSG
jgi:hypothetical protein